MRTPARLVAMIALFGWTPPASAQDTSTSTIATSTATPSIPPVAVADVRPEDARSWAQRPDDKFEDTLLFVPRAILFVPQLALRILYLPFRGALWLINEYSLDERLIDLLYNDERTAAILPLVLYLPGLGPRAGINAFHNDLFGNLEHGAISAAFGGIDTQAYNIELEADRLAGTHFWLEVQARYEREARSLFAGIGIPAEDAVDTRFSEDRWLGRLRAGATLGPIGERVKIGGSLIYNRRRFGAAKSLLAGDRSIETVYDTSMLNGFNQGIDLFEVTGDLVLDFRDHAGFTSNGLYLETFAGGAPAKDGYQFAHYGLETAVFIDLYKQTRVLVLRAAVEAVEGDLEQIPFSELPRLGGADRLRGYRVDIFRDKKILLGSVEYHYPIHKNLAGQIFFDIGTAAPNYRDLFRGGSDDWKIGYGAGLLLGSADSLWFRLDVSYGDGLMVFLSTDAPHAFSGRTEEL